MMTDYIGIISTDEGMCVLHTSALNSEYAEEEFQSICREPHMDELNAILYRVEEFDVGLQADFLYCLRVSTGQRVTLENV